MQNVITVVIVARHHKNLSLIESWDVFMMGSGPDLNNKKKRTLLSSFTENSNEKDVTNQEHVSAVSKFASASGSISLHSMKFN